MVKDIVVDFIHFLEHIWLKVSLPALATYPRRDIADHQQFATPPVVIFNPFLAYLSTTKCAIAKARHGLIPLVRGSLHFGGCGI